ncbi:MAG TPA: S9 family peptidase, partial [Propionibacterium sp.]|nr:S9 family peptidase [Propionibacterium sp.]
MRPDQIPLLTSVGRPTVHPDGSFALVAATAASFEADGYTGQLWRVPLDGGAPRRATRGFADSSPQFSPNGRLVAFLRRSPGEPAQVFVAPAEGGEAAQATDAKLGVGGFCWSPDSTTLAFTARVPEEGRYGTLDGVPAPQEDPRHLVGFQTQSNGLGWWTDRVRQLFVVAAPDPWGAPPVKPVGRAAKDAGPDTSWAVPEARQVTHGEWDVADPVFAPAGDAVLVATRAGEDADGHLRAGVHRVCVDSGATTPVVSDTRHTFTAPCPSSDGAWLYVLGSDLGDDGLDFVATNASVFVVGADGGAPVRLTDPEDLDLTGPLSPAGADGVLVVREHRGRGELLRVAPDGTTTTIGAGGAGV